MKILVTGAKGFVGKNLCAQKGLFTYWPVEKGVNRDGFVNTDETLRTPLNELIQQTLTEKETPLMYKIRISRSGINALYDYLKSNHVEAATLFPGYDGVVKSIKENQYFKIFKQNC